MKIAIAGFGAEGRSSYQYWRAPTNQLTIVDQRSILADDLPPDVKTIFGEQAFLNLNGFDMIVRTASLLPNRIKADGGIIWSQTNEFFARCPAPIIGVTGTKGKGTTSSLITHLLQAAGKKVYLVGNIGVPALDVLKQIKADDIVVYELSSFQLIDLQKSPNVAVVLHIEPDHLDVHANFEEYLAAKSQITNNQTTVDRVVYNPHNQFARQIAELSVGQRLAYSSLQTAHVLEGDFYYGKTKLCSTKQLRLPGNHNQQNACAAITTVWPWLQNSEAIGRGLNAFDGLDHRLKFVANINDVDFFDDSISTSISSTVAAINSFDNPKILILGGSSKGVQFDQLARTIKQANIRQILLIGPEAASIEQALLKVDFASAKIINFANNYDMTAVVGAAHKVAKPGDVVLLSPACASFDKYQNYAERGQQFITAVKNLQS